MNENEIRTLEIGDTLDACPQCDYADGFHISFLREEDAVFLILICPKCSARFDVGLAVQG